MHNFPNCISLIFIAITNFIVSLSHASIEGKHELFLLDKDGREVRSLKIYFTEAPAIPEIVIQIDKSQKITLTPRDSSFLILNMVNGALAKHRMHPRFRPAQQDALGQFSFLASLHNQVSEPGMYPAFPISSNDPIFGGSFGLVNGASGFQMTLNDERDIPSQNGRFVKIQFNNKQCGGNGNSNVNINFFLRPRDEVMDNAIRSSFVICGIIINVDDRSKIVHYYDNVNFKYRHRDSNNEPDSGGASGSTRVF
ncbi:hypothetical protein [Endozoicomonas euniceicola]|uniref:PPIase cyclophilin-type domain-containing protein n=1 Tax=Endozoicomonas euniceicola TaxID=1234143 RepID=A0ABY6GPS1_9GAMM|nr:hypothetical protein [Endozoicomonas euniceicola]UYM14141.1 hypothetical protein NX720_14630 [Endozoicomonas euniceicola]